MKLVLNIDVGIGSELVETSCAYEALGRPMSLDDLVLARLQGTAGNLTSPWVSITQSSKDGDIHLRIPRVSRKHQEEEGSYLERIVAVFRKLSELLHASCMGKTAIAQLQTNYDGVVTLLQERILELHKDALERQEQREQTAKDEAAERVRVKAIQASNKTRRQALNLSDPFSGMVEEPGEDLDPTRIMTAIKKEARHG